MPKEPRQLTEADVQQLTKCVIDAEKKLTQKSDTEISYYWHAWSNDTPIISHIARTVANEVTSLTQLEEMYVAGLFGLARVYLASGISLHQQEPNTVDRKNLSTRFSSYQQIFERFKAIQRTPQTITQDPIFWPGERAYDSAQYFVTINQPDEALKRVQRGLKESTKALNSIVSQDESDSLMLEAGSLSALAILYAQQGQLTANINDMIEAVYRMNEANHLNYDRPRTQIVAQLTKEESVKALLKGQVKLGLEALRLSTSLSLQLSANTLMDV